MAAFERRPGLGKPSGDLTPMRVPSFPNRKRQVPDAGILQPMMQMHPRAKTAGTFPDHFADMVTAKRAAIAGGTAFIGPSEESVRGLSKFQGTAGDVENQADLRIGGLGGGNQGGRYPGNDDHIGGDLPSHVDLSQHRPAQMLSQLSEVMMHGARTSGLDPTEIQFGYGLTESGDLNVFASANKPETQAWLSEAMTSEPGSLLEHAALHGDEEIANIGTKLLFHDEQQGRRRAENTATGTDVGTDLDLSSAIRAKFLSRDITVVKNESGDSGRHAEQNIGAAMHTRAIHSDGFRFGDIQGTKIRCHACRASLGGNLRDQTGTGASGKVYTSQASEADFLESFTQVASGTERIITTQPQRPRANSFATLPAFRPATPQGGDGGSSMGVDT